MPSDPESTELDGMAVLQALSDPVRLAIVRQLAVGSMCELTCGNVHVTVTKSTVSHHIKILVSAGIVAQREDGRRKFLQLRRAELERRFPGLLDAILRATCEESGRRAPRSGGT